MQLGGKPPQLYDQVRDGVADVVWTLPSYTPGRFPLMSVFELPFMINNAEATTKAAWEFYQTYAKEEFADVHPILFHVRSEEHTSELQSLMRISYAVFCLKKKKKEKD